MSQMTLQGCDDVSFHTQSLGCVRQRERERYRGLRIISTRKKEEKKILQNIASVLSEKNNFHKLKFL